MLINKILLVLIGFSSGIVISGAIVAFIISIGVITHLAEKTKTKKYKKIYQNVFLLSSIFGMFAMYSDVQIKLGALSVILMGFFDGIFIGYLAMALVEVIDVVPTFKERANFKASMAYIVYSIAIGKMVGSLIYWIIPGFYNYKT